MRKFTLLLSGIIFAASTVFANSPTQRLALPALEKTSAEKAVKPANATNLSMKRAATPARIKKAAASTGFDMPIITEAPAGETKMYKKSAAGYFVYFMWIASYEDTFSSEIVFTDNNEVYIKDIFANLPVGSYVKGTVSDGVITVDLPQCIMYDEEYEDGYKIAAVKYYEDEETATYLPDEDVDKITFTIDADGSITMDENITLGLLYTSDDYWAGYADLYQSYEVFDGKPVEKPESVSTEKWALSTPDGNGHFVNVGIDGNDMYIGGLSESMPDGWIKGTISGDKVTFENDQYIGIANSHFTYFFAGARVFDEEYQDYYYALSDKPAVLNYDAEGKKLTSPEGLTLLVNGSETKVYYLNAFDEPTIKYQGAMKPATPANPHSLITNGYEPDYGGQFYFILPMVDTEGNLLDLDNYYYNIYFDNELFTFYADEYEKFEALGIEEITNIPYNFTEDWDFYINGAEHTIYYYVDGFETIGVQAVYTIDGVTNKSDLVNFNLETGNTNIVKPAALETIESAKEVSATVYYDLTGRKVDNPSNGLFIKKTIYSDGTVKTVKRAVK